MSEFKEESVHELNQPEAQVTTPKKKNIFLRIALSKYFELFIICSIVTNTVIMCMERHPWSEEEQEFQDNSNLAFTAIFFAEMIIKILGFGPKGYIRDRFNIFDAIVVIVSIVDTTVTSVLEYEVNVGDAISTFRIFRLFRVIKLVKRWKKFQELVDTIIVSLKDARNFSVLLFLFIFIYALLGRELFAFKIMFNEEGKLDADNEESTSPRTNFDTFYNAMITIFILLTGEQWDQILHDAYRYQKYIALAFFISLTVIGQMILLNLFLAILLENFDMTEEQHQANKEKSQYISKAKAWIRTK